MKDQPAMGDHLLVSQNLLYIVTNLIYGNHLSSNNTSPVLYGSAYNYDNSFNCIFRPYNGKLFVIEPLD